MIGATYDTAQIGARRVNWRLGMHEELRKIDCEPCGADMAVWEPDHAPEPGFVWSWRCWRCGSMLVGRRDGDDPLAHAHAPLSQRVILPPSMAR